MPAVGGVRVPSDRAGTPASSSCLVCPWSTGAPTAGCATRTTWLSSPRASPFPWCTALGVYSAWLTALLFTAANAAVLTVRLRAENKALGLATQVRVAGCRRRQVAPVSPCGGATRLVQPLVQGVRPPRLGHDLADSSRTPDGGPGRGRTPEGERGGPPTPPLRGGTMRQTGPTGAKTAMSKEMQDCVDACMACHGVRDHIRRGQRRHTRAPHHQGGRRAGKLPAAQAAPSAYPRLSGAARHQAVGRGHVCRRRPAVSCRPGCRTTRGS